MASQLLRSIATGISSGAFQGATGVGGSIIMVSALTSKWGLRLPQAIATGCSLPTQLLGNTTAVAVLIAASEAKDDTHIDLLNVAAIAVPATAAVAVGTRIGAGLSNAALKLIFGCVLAGLAPVITHRALTSPVRGEVAAQTTPIAQTTVADATAGTIPDAKISSRVGLGIAGCAMGLLMSVVGVGGGPIIVSYLSLQVGSSF